MCISLPISASSIEQSKNRVIEIEEEKGSQIMHPLFIIHYSLHPLLEGKEQGVDVNKSSDLIQQIKLSQTTNGNSKRFQSRKIDSVKQNKKF